MPRRPSPRQRQLNAALGQTADRFGRGIVRRLGDVSSRDLGGRAVPTGSLRLELATGLGDYSRGQQTEILGSASSGKTVPLYDALAATQWQIGVACHEEGEYAAPALRSALAEVRVIDREMEAAHLLTPAATRQLAVDLRRIAASAGASEHRRGDNDAAAAD